MYKNMYTNIYVYIFTYIYRAKMHFCDKRAGGRADSKEHPERCSRKTEDKFAIASMAKKLLHS